MAASQIVTQLLYCGVLLAVGFLCGRCGILDVRANRGITDLVVLIVTPCMIFCSYQIDYSAQLAENLLSALLLSAVCVAVQTACAYLFVRRRGERLALERLSVIFGNCGFMGLPLVQSLCGAEGILYFTAYITCTNSLLWTHGVLMVSGGEDRCAQLRHLLSPALFSVLLGLGCFLLRIRVPATVLAPVEMLAALNTPLAMLVAGVSIAQSDYRHVFSTARAYYIVLLRNVAAPILCMLAICLFPRVMQRPAEVMIILSACPAATICTMFAQRYKKDASYAAQLFALSTLFSIVSIPLLFLLAGAVVGGFFQ